MLGRIHSIETMGLNDGPGIRFTAFFQGCPLRCAYCHNPDTWSLKDGYAISADELYQRALKYLPYYNRSGGGVTCSGGEPLIQPEFLIRFLKLCKKGGIHTALDTSGVGNDYYDEILHYLDLVLLDIKAPTDNEFVMLTQTSLSKATAFYEALKRSRKKIWIRHVVVPNLNDKPHQIQKVYEFAQQFSCVERIELLPYHTLGIHKYEHLEIPYALPTLINANTPFTSHSL